MIKRIIIPLLFVLSGCASTQPVIQPTPACPACPGPVIMVEHDTVTKTLHDTSFAEMWDTVTRYIVSDTNVGAIRLSPFPGDSYPELQAAIDYQIANPGHRILLSAGAFYISHPLIAAKIVNGDYIQVCIDIEGVRNAKNCPQAFATNIFPTYTDGFALGLQNNKGSVIKNIHFGGLYDFPNTLSQIDVDTLAFDQWKTPKCRDERTSPYAAIVIDPFGDPATYASQSYATMYPGLESYYLPGMSRSGSTAINISGCSIYDFVVGVLVTAAFQYNGELINVTDCRIDNCKVCYAYSQAQSKANTLFDLMVWGGVHTILDGVNYGFGHTDASCAPFVDTWNVAGSVHQLFNVYATTFPFSAKRVYAESLFKIGIVNGRAGTHFDDFQIDFGNSGYGFPSPDFYYAGYVTTWTNCMLRLYTDRLPTPRIILDFPTNTFQGGSMNAPPVCWNGQLQFPAFHNVGMQYYRVVSQVLDSNNYDHWDYIDHSDTLHLDRSDFSGWFNAVNTAGLAVGDIIVTSKRYEDQESAITGSNYPVGFVSAIQGNKVLLQNMGVGIREGDIITPVHYSIKPLP